METATGLKSKYFDYLYSLPQGKADHPGDFSSRSISRIKLEKGLATGDISSFNMSNEEDLGSENIYAMYYNSRDHGGLSTVTLHFPERTFNNKLELVAERFIGILSPSYGFRCCTGDAAKGVSYHLSSTIFKNERGNFSAYISGTEVIRSPRMIYPINYFSENQLSQKAGGLPLRDFIFNSFGNDMLKKVGGSVYRMDVDAQDLPRINDVFGAAGFLISWIEPRKKK